MRYFSALIVALGLLFSSATARAQMQDRISEHPAPREVARQQVETLTREMANRLHLNEGQYLKLFYLNRIRLSALSAIDREFRDDATARASKAAELQAQFEQECSLILTPTQLSQLRQESQPATAPATAGNGLG